MHRTDTITRRALNKQELVAELEPLAPSKRGFESRPPPVKLTEEEKAAIDRALEQRKRSGFFDLRDNYQLEQQNGRRS